jgi:transposase
MVARICIGIDISKDWFDACAWKGRKLPVSRFAQSPEGVAEFLAWTKELGARTCHVCMEHTGGYEATLALACRDACLSVSLVDGAAISSYRASFGRRHAKTDKSDARLLARYCRERRPAVWSPRPEPYGQLTELVRHREDLIKDSTAWKCRSSNPCQNELVVRQRATQLDVLKLQIEELTKVIKQHIKASPELSEDIELLDTITGIRFTSAVRILGEMGPVANYKTPRDLALHAGLVPLPFESGKSNGKCFLPTYGSRELRNALYLPAVVATTHDDAIKAFAKRVDGNGGKLKKTVLIAAMRKLAHVIHGVLTHRTPYSTDILFRQMKAPS